MKTPAPVSSRPARAYLITGVLGHGGFGTVYRARMTAEGGFVKDVAIKVLADEDPPANILARFRDEARILGLLRDHHIVSVDPPIQLNGRWAVVMEYVDGESCYALLRHGPFPVRCALEVVREVAMTLVNVFGFEGPDGTSMELLHRDLKPANLQITPKGDVKVLDFGVARARFQEREVHTYTDFVGTPGYIAPERVHGDEGPYGDVFSLGVVLFMLLTARKPPPPMATPAPIPDGLTTLEMAAWRLAQRMQSVRPEERPTAEEVVQQCDKLLREWAGPGLRVWAVDKVAPRPAEGDDSLVGLLLQPESPSSRPLRDAPTLTQTRMAMMVVPVGGSVLLLSVLVTAIFSVVFTLWWLRPPEPELTPAVGKPVPIEVVAVPVPVVQPAAPVQAPAPIPSPEPVVVVQPTTVEPRPPRPVEIEPAPEPAPVASSGTVSLVGAERLELRGASGTFGVGSVPAGEYTIYVSFGEGMIAGGRLEVRGGSSAVVRCQKAFARCVVE